MSTYFQHTITGIIAEYPDHYRDHPVLSKYLVEVPKPTRGCTDCGLPVEDEPAVVEQTEGVPAEDQWRSDYDYDYTDYTDTEKD